MARNIEIKARLEQVDVVMAKANALANAGPTEIVQDDTFFACPHGRLKLRVFSSRSGELIFYQRSDDAGPKESRYSIFPTNAPGVLRGLLSSALGEIGRVKKIRTLFLIGRTRVHFDQVEGLGNFLELEVVLRDDELAEAGVIVATDLMHRLGVSNESLVRGAYIDLLTAGDRC